MSFMLWGLPDVIAIIFNALRGLFGFLCEILYTGIASLYELFIDLGSYAYAEKFVTIYNRISLIIGIFMVFRLTFWLIEALINPDNLNDKEKNPGKLIQKVLVSVVLLAVTPNIFKYAFDLQNKILESKVIEKVIVGGEGLDASETGRFLAAELFMNFYTPTVVDGKTFSNDFCVRDFTGDEGRLYTEFIETGKLTNLNNECLSNKTKVGDTEYFVIDFNGVFAVAVGGFVFWMILMYCISLGTRYVQLIYLQIIAPIPIMCHLAPGKDEIFSKWVKQCTTTYLDLFIRIAIINFSMLLCGMILENNSGIIASFDHPNPWIEVFLILGLLTFAKKAPELIQELLPKGLAKASGDFGLSLKKRSESMLGGKFMYSTGKKAIGFVGTAPFSIGRNLAVRAINAHSYNQKENKKLNRLRSQKIANLTQARDRVNANMNLSDEQRRKGVEGLNQQINSLQNMSNRDFRNTMKKQNKNFTNILENIDDNDSNAAKKRAGLMNKITENRNAGMGQRSQTATAVTSVLGGIADSANAAIHSKSFSETRKKARESQVHNIIREQGWYNEGGYPGVKNTVQRVVAQVQKRYGLETEGQTLKFIVDDLDFGIKEQEGLVNETKETVSAYSNNKASLKTIETEGGADTDKNKAIKVYNKTKGTWELVQFSNRTGQIETALQRVGEYFKNLSPDNAMQSIDDNEEAKKVLESLINIVSDNSSSDPKEQTELRNLLTNYLNSAPNVETAFNAVLTSSHQSLGKISSDYKKLQSAAGVLNHLFSSAGHSLDKEFYRSDAIAIGYDSMIRELNANSDRYSKKIIDLKNQLETFTAGKSLNDFTEESINKVSKILKEMKENFDLEQAQKSIEVSDLLDKLNAMKSEKESFIHYTETTDAMNADKFSGGGGKK